MFLVISSVSCAWRFSATNSAANMSVVKVENSCEDIFSTLQNNFTNKKVANQIVLYWHTAHAQCNNQKNNTVMIVVLQFCLILSSCSSDTGPITKLLSRKTNSCLKKRICKYRVIQSIIIYLNRSLRTALALLSAVECWLSALLPTSRHSEQ